MMSRAERVTSRTPLIYRLFKIQGTLEVLLECKIPCRTWRVGIKICQGSLQKKSNVWIPCQPPATQITRRSQRKHTQGKRGVCAHRQQAHWSEPCSPCAPNHRTTKPIQLWQEHKHHGWNRSAKKKLIWTVQYKSKVLCLFLWQIS